MNPVPDLNPDSSENDYDSLNDLYELNFLVAERYHRHLVEDVLELPEHPATQYLHGKRGLNPDQINAWNVGYAPENWRFITDAVKTLDAFDQALAIGACRDHNNRHYDVFNSRVMLPIYNADRRVSGFSARSIGVQKNKEGQELPKYINTANTVIFKKEELFFGMNRAMTEILRTRTVTLTEGPFDVIALHRASLTNTLGKQGSALTEPQLKWLVDHCDLVTLIYDVDPNESGQKALERDTEKLLRAGLRVRVFRLPQPEGSQEGKLVKVDADSWVQSYLLLQPGDQTQLAEQPYPVDGPACKLPEDKGKLFKRFGKLDLTGIVKQEAVDGLMDLATRWLNQDEIDDEVLAQKQIISIVASVRDDTYVDAYVERLSKQFAWNKRTLRKSIETARKAKKGEASDDEDPDKMPDWVNVKDYYYWGFAEHINPEQPDRTGYYFPGYNGISTSPITNFVITPLYLIKEQGNVRRLVEFNNGFRKEYAELDSKVLTGMTSFEQTLTDLGYYTVEEDFERKHLKRIVNKLLAKTPTAYPIRTLGWQPEGFFAFSNVVFNGHLEKFNEHGIVEVNNQTFFSPSLSPTNRSYRQEDDAYKHDRYLSWRTTEVTFRQWGEQLRLVYGERAMIGVTFVVATLFKDIVKKLAKIPLLYLYGPKDSGKSTYAESLLYVFFSGKDANGDLMKPMNLGAQPTLAAFWTALARYRNCPFVFNEFDVNRVEPFVPTAFKAAWDNEGRSRQSKDNKYQTEEQNVNCAPIIVGQYLATGDDGAVLSRSLVFEFHNRKDDPFTPDEIKHYSKLREWEQAGLNGLLSELLPLRPKLEKEFGETFRLVSDELFHDLEKREIPFETRTFQNVVCLLTIYDVLATSIHWPMTRAEFWNYGRHLIQEMKSQMHESDVLTGFWSMLEYLLDRGDIVEGWDFKIETSLQAKITASTGKPETITFDKPVRILYFRMGNVHKPYAENLRKQSSEKPHSEQTLTTYIQQQKYFLGKNSKTYFSKGGGTYTNSNALVINYDLLSEKTGLSLERIIETPEEKLEQRTYSGQVLKDFKLHQVAPGPKVEFVLQITESGRMTTVQYNLKCFIDETRINLPDLAIGSRWKVMGNYSEKSWKNGKEEVIIRQLDVLTAECLDKSVSMADGYPDEFSTTIKKGEEGF